MNVGGAGRATDIPAFPDVNGFLDFELAGAIVQSTMLSAVSGGIALALDIESGFIDRLFAAPIPRTAIVVGRLATTAVMGVIAGVWFITIGLIFGAEIQGGVAGRAARDRCSRPPPRPPGAASARRSRCAAARVSVVQGIFPIVFVIIFLSSAFFPSQPAARAGEVDLRLEPDELHRRGAARPDRLGHLRAAACSRGCAAIAGVMALGTALSIWGLRKRLAG